ncbi:hypothetical protein RB195_001170 [Necator americanus]|uniref:Uncharacterized protein n=1 Tax=Necator americanus TaxID=51031 RepID=A0ABR1DDW1_NECAM
MKYGKSGGNDGSSAEILKSLSSSGIREMTKIIRSIFIDERILDWWRHTIIIPLHKNLSVMEPSDYRLISPLRVMYEVLERIILDRLIRHREEISQNSKPPLILLTKTVFSLILLTKTVCCGPNTSWMYYTVEAGERQETMGRPSPDGSRVRRRCSSIRFWQRKVTTRR